MRGAWRARGRRDSASLEASERGGCRAEGRRTGSRPGGRERAPGVRRGPCRPGRGGEALPKPREGPGEGTGCPQARSAAGLAPQPEVASKAPSRHNCGFVHFSPYAEGGLFALRLSIRCSFPESRTVSQVTNKVIFLCVPTFSTYLKGAFPA